MYFYSVKILMDNIGGKCEKNVKKMCDGQSDFFVISYQKKKNIFKNIENLDFDTLAVTHFFLFFRWFDIGQMLKQMSPRFLLFQVSFFFPFPQVQHVVECLKVFLSAVVTSHE